MRNIHFGEPITQKAELEDRVSLQQLKNLEVVACQETGVPMLNIDADQILPGDLRFIKKLGLTISNPDTDRPVALGVDYIEESWGEKIHRYLDNDSDEDSDDEDDDDDDDSSFFGAGGFLGGVGSGGFSGGGSGGFGGFGGGSFSGGGASASF